MVFLLNVMHVSTAKDAVSGRLRNREPFCRNFGRTTASVTHCLDGIYLSVVVPPPSQPPPHIKSNMIHCPAASLSLSLRSLSLPTLSLSLLSAAIAICTLLPITMRRRRRKIAFAAPLRQLENHSLIMCCSCALADCHFRLHGRTPSVKTTVQRTSVTITSMSFGRRHPCSCIESP